MQCLGLVVGVLGCSPSVTEESTAAMAGEGMGGVGVGSHVSQVNGVVHWQKAEPHTFSDQPQFASF